MNRGFTLTEVLITLGIIGVVAAMTLPAINRNIENKERVPAVKKAYSIISQATLMAVKDNGDASTWTIADHDIAITDKIYSYYKPYLKIIHYCRAEKGCWTNEVSDLSGKKFHWYTSGILGADAVTARINDGMSICFDVFKSQELGVNIHGAYLVFLLILMAKNALTHLEKIFLPLCWMQTKMLLYRLAEIQIRNIAPKMLLYLTTMQELTAQTRF